MPFYSFIVVEPTTQEIDVIVAGFAIPMAFGTPFLSTLSMSLSYTNTCPVFPPQNSQGLPEHTTLHCSGATSLADLAKVLSQMHVEAAVSPLKV